MNNTFWFNLIRQWKEDKMGLYGVTFPFLAGAISRQTGEKITKASIETLFNKIIEMPVKDHYCEVRWCGDIDEPVVSVERTSAIEQKSINAQYKNAEHQPSLAFTTDLMSMFALNCNTKEECLVKLVERTLQNTEKGQFSKNNGVFGEFTAEEIEFIENVAKNSRNT